MKDKYKISIILIIIGLILWLLYLCDLEMSRYGIYTIFSYNFHEGLSIVPLLSVIVTICWLIIMIAGSVKNKDIKSNIFFNILLLVLCVIQFMYLHNRYQTVSTSFVTSIESIDREKLEIIINKDEYDLTLDCPMLVLNLIKTDGTEYGITYEWNKNNPNYGKLCMIQSIE